MSQNYDPKKAPKIITASLPAATAGKKYKVKLEAKGGKTPYRWSLHGGRLPAGLKVNKSGKIVGTPKKTEQLAFIIDCTDSKGQHDSKGYGLFMIPPAKSKKTIVDFTKGQPADGKTCNSADGPYLCFPGSESKDRNGKATMSNYSAELVFSPQNDWNQYNFAGIVLNTSPAGDSSDLLNIVVANRGRTLSIYSRYKDQSYGEVWPKLDYPLIADPGETDKAIAIDRGENWTLKVMVRPGKSKGAMDLLVGVFDQNGKPRFDGTRRFDVANGMMLIRELVVKKELQHGPLGVIPAKAGHKTLSYWHNQ